MVGELADYIETAIGGRVVTRIVDGLKSYDVVLRLDDPFRNNVEMLKQLPVDIGKGHLIPLELLVRIEEGKGPNIINRENVSRRIFVSANVENRDLVSAVHELQKKIEDEIEFPEGYFVTYGGQFESQAQASQLIYVLGFFSLIGMFFVLFVHFKDLSLALQVMLSIPFCVYRRSDLGLAHWRSSLGGFVGWADYIDRNCREKRHLDDRSFLAFNEVRRREIFV